MKLSFGLFKALGRQSEGKQVSLENYTHQPLKIENMSFSWVSFSQSYLWKMPLKHNFSREEFTRETVAR